MATLHRCWVIVDGSQPTAFHSRDAEQLIPTLKQLQRTQPHVALMWFERGKLWVSPEAARQALRDRRSRPESRSRDWRPGGEHRDPKARPDVPRDVKRARFKKRLIEERIRTSEQGRNEDKPASAKRPRPGWTNRDQPWSARPPSRSNRPPSDRPRSDSQRSDRPRSDKPPSGARGFKGKTGGFGHTTTHKPGGSHRNGPPRSDGRNAGPNRGSRRSPDKKRNPK